MALKDTPATLSWSVDQLIKQLNGAGVEFKVHIEMNKPNEASFVVTTRVNSVDQAKLSYFLKKFYGYQKK